MTTTFTVNDIDLHKARIDHIKNFQKITGNDNGGIWNIRWDGGKDPVIYNDRNKTVEFTIDDIHMAEYIVSLHNFMVNILK